MGKWCWCGCPTWLILRDTNTESTEGAGLCAGNEQRQKEAAQLIHVLLGEWLIGSTLDLRYNEPLALATNH